jgi:hypothetical protein
MLPHASYGFGTLRTCLMSANMLFLLFVIISDPVGMFALRPSFLPNDTPAR